MFPLAKAPQRLVLAGSLLTLLIGLFGLNPYLLMGGDNANYISQAESLLKSGHLSQIFFDGSPPTSLSPPLFPVLLAGVEALFGRNVIAMKVVIVLFAAASVWAAWFALRAGLAEGSGREDADRTAAIGAFWFAISPTWGLLAHEVLTDVPFTFLTLLAIGCTGRAARKDARWTWFVAALLLLLTATLVRYAGILIVAGCTAYMAAKALFSYDTDRARLRIYCALLFLFGVALFWETQHGEGTTMAAATAAITATNDSQSVLGQRIEHFLRVGKYYSVFLSAETAGFDGFDPAALLAFLGMPLLVLGIIRMFRRRQFLIPICWIIYQAGLLPLPWMDARYFLPVLPLFLCLVWTGTEVCLEWASSQGSLATAAAAFSLCLLPMVSLLGTYYSLGLMGGVDTNIFDWVVGAVLLGGLILIVTTRAIGRTDSQAPLFRPLLYTVLSVFLGLAALRSVCENAIRSRAISPATEQKDWGDFYAAGQWLTTNGSEEDLVISSRPSLIWFWSGRKGFGIHRDAKRLENEMSRAKWAIIDNIPEDHVSQIYLAPLLDADRGWSEAWRQNSTVVMRKSDR